MKNRTLATRRCASTTTTNEDSNLLLALSRCWSVIHRVMLINHRRAGWSLQKAQEKQLFYFFWCLSRSLTLTLMLKAWEREREQLMLHTCCWCSNDVCIEKQVCWDAAFVSAHLACSLGSEPGCVPTLVVLRAQHWNKEACAASMLDEGDGDFLFRSFFIVFFSFSFLSLCGVFFFNLVCFLRWRRLEQSAAPVALFVAAAAVVLAAAADENEEEQMTSSSLPLLLLLSLTNTFLGKPPAFCFHFHVRRLEIIEVLWVTLNLLCCCWWWWWFFGCPREKQSRCSAGFFCDGDVDTEDKFDVLPFSLRFSPGEVNNVRVNDKLFSSSSNGDAGRELEDEEVK